MLRSGRHRMRQVAGRLSVEVTERGGMAESVMVRSSLVEVRVNLRKMHHFFVLSNRPNEGGQLFAVLDGGTP
jgi:hypothetical protein